MVEPIECAQLVGATASRLLGLRPGSAQGKDLCFVDSAVSRSEWLVGMLLTPSPRSVTPVAGAAEVRDLATGRDGVAIHRPGGVEAELPVDCGQGRVVDESEARRHLTAVHQRDALIDGADGPQVGVTHPRAHFDRTLSELNGLISVPRVQREHALAEIEVPVLSSLRLGFEELLGALEPSG